MMKTVKMFGTVAMLSVFACGCCAAECDAKDATKTACTKTEAKTEAAAQQQAVTPEGEVIMIVSCWEAEAACPQKDGCKTAQCWKTKDGKTYCAKPLKECPAGEKGECYKAKDGKVMAVDTEKSCKEAKKCVVKEVKACPANGKEDCKAPEHVKMDDGKKGCAKADLKATTAKTADDPAPMSDEVEEDDFFVVALN